MAAEWERHRGARRRSGRSAYGSLEEVRPQHGVDRLSRRARALRAGQGRGHDPGERPEQISLLRLDTDWYESTRHELEHLYPRLAPGGVLIIDDYGHWAGRAQAVDEFLAGRADAPLLNRIDYTGRIGVKR